RVTPRQAGTYSYGWEPGGTAGNTIASRAAGTYTVRVEDALHHSNKLTYRVGYKTYWDSLHGATVSGDTLKTTGAYMWGR
ncbi:hypothetical protein, partial [Salmonella enterica]|uniref:hypothetical protein n=1 Tax=Salmonella enterica TaxID=28901 RepID=UPI0020A47B91